MHNVHRPEKLDSGFFTAVVIDACVAGEAIEVLRAVAAHRAAVPVRAGPCISDTMSLRAACSLLTPFVAVGAVGHLSPQRSFVRTPLRSAMRSPKRCLRAQTRLPSSAMKVVPAPASSLMSSSVVPAALMGWSSPPSSALPARRAVLLPRALMRLAPRSKRHTGEPAASSPRARARSCCPGFAVCLQRGHRAPGPSLLCRCASSLERPRRGSSSSPSASFRPPLLERCSRLSWKRTAVGCEQKGKPEVERKCRR